MTDLVSRVRNATEGSGELDALVCMACFPYLRAPMEYIKGEPPLFFDEPFYKQEPPRVTTSLDAAIALCERVLPGWYWSVEKGGADVTSPEGISYGADLYDVPTPALALTLAILMAKGRGA